MRSLCNLPGDMIVVDCAGGCGLVIRTSHPLAGATGQERPNWPPLARGRIRGRAYCSPCLESQSSPPGCAGPLSDRQYHGGKFNRGEW